MKKLDPRNSTKAGGAGIGSFFIVWALGVWAPMVLVSAPGGEAMAGSMITAVLMWAGARWFKASKKIGSVF